MSSNEELYGPKFQKAMIDVILTSHGLYTKVASILDPKYFDQKFQKVIKFVIDYANENSAVPSFTEVNVMAPEGIEFKPAVGFEENNQDGFAKLVEKFCRNRAILNAVIECADLLEKDKPDTIEKKIKDATMVSLAEDNSVNIFEHPKEILERIHSVQGTISTGWTTIDSLLDGGFGWGELEYVIAPSGGGKSVILQNLTVNFLNQGYNVLYISLELSSDLIAKRIYGMLADFKLKNMKGCEQKVEDAVLSKIEKTKNFGDLSVVYVRPGSKVADIEAVIQKYEERTGKVPQFLVIDYADRLIAPGISRENEHLMGDIISEDLRSICMHRTILGKNMTCLTASQVKKDAMDDGATGMSSISGSSAKVFNADNIWAAYSGPQMREQQRMKFEFIKTRTSGGFGKTVMMHYDLDTLKISDMRVGDDIKAINGTLKKVVSGDQEFNGQSILDKIIRQ